MRVHVISPTGTASRYEAFMQRNVGVPIEYVPEPLIEDTQVDRDGLLAAGVIAERDIGITDGALGYALTHMALWKRARDENQSLTICEDHAVLRQDFVEFHRHHVVLREGFDTIHWGFNLDMHACYELPGYGELIWSTDHRQFHAEGAVEAFQNARHPVRLYRARRLYGLPCYTVSPEGARKLLDLSKPLRKDVEYFDLTNGFGHVHPMFTWTGGVDFFCVKDLASGQLNSWVAMPPMAIRPTGEVVDMTHAQAASDE